MHVYSRPKERPPRGIICFPNELTDGRPGSLYQPDSIAFTPPEPDGSGRYNLINWWISVLNREERLEVAFRALQAQQRTMRRAFEEAPEIPCSHIPRCIVRGIQWDPSDDDVTEHMRRVTQLLWWRDLVSISIDERRDDPDVERELAHHEW